MITPDGGSPSSALPPPSRARYRLIVFAVALAVVQYIDRVCISQAMPDIAKDLHLTDNAKGLIFSAFTFAYALFEIPTGWLGDRIGAKKVLLRVVLWWSFFTAATGWAWNYWSMLLTRFLFGAGEAGCFPNLTKALSAWLPVRDRTRAQGLMWMGARWGGASAPLLVVAVMAFVTWRTAFMIFALLGVGWAYLFYRWFRDNPRDHPSVNPGELALLKGNEKNMGGHANVPWSEMLWHRSLWLLCLQYAFLSYGWYFYVTWLPDYLRSERHLEIKANIVMATLGDWLNHWFNPALSDKFLAAALAGIPLLFGGFGSLVVGAVTPRLVARGFPLAAIRRCFGFVGLTGAAGLLMGSYYIRDPLLAMLAMGLASFCNDVVVPGGWASCMDIGGRYAGTVSGSMNMVGNIGGVAGPIVVGQVLTLTGRNWELAFMISAVIYFLGALCWLFIDPVTPLPQGNEDAAEAARSANAAGAG